MVLWKGKQDWQKPLATFTMKKREPKKAKWNRRYKNWYWRNTKKPKEILWVIICQQIWQPWRNGQVSVNTKPIKTEPRKNNLNRLINRSEVEYVVYSRQSKTQFSPYQNIPWHFTKLEKVILKLIWNYKRPCIAKAPLWKKVQNWRLLPNFRL